MPRAHMRFIVSTPAYQAVVMALFDWQNKRQYDNVVFAVKESLDH